MKLSLAAKASLHVLPIAALAALAAAAPPAGWSARGVGGGGALYSPSWSPHQSDEMFVACDMTELFHTTTRGVTWSQSDFRQLAANQVLG